jgi:hypothetical protein
MKYEKCKYLMRIKSKFPLNVGTTILKKGDSVHSKSNKKQLTHFVAHVTEDVHLGILDSTLD